jgi:hypothetical protein
MKCLLHCVFRQAGEGLPDGCGGDVFVVTGYGLAGAASPANEGDAAPALSRLVAYQRVIEAFHASRAVIPMRYGCLLEGEPAILRLLEEHRQEYETLLTRLAGMVEMGIRILYDQPAESCRGDAAGCHWAVGAHGLKAVPLLPRPLPAPLRGHPAPGRGSETILSRARQQAEETNHVLRDPHGLKAVPPRAASDAAPGAAYLAGLRKRHPPGDGLEAEEGRLAERIAGALGGCHERLRAEASDAAGGRLLSLYFLTPRTSVADFRDRVRRMQLPKGTRLLLSGPWPPYNFVSSPTPAGR